MIRLPTHMNSDLSLASCYVLIEMNYEANESKLIKLIEFAEKFHTCMNIARAHLSDV